jgi:hypothetical protein
MLRYPIKNTLYGVVASGGGATVPALDPPISSAITSKSYHAFGFDRMQEGYAGNSVRLKRLSDNVEANFGFDATSGIFDHAGVVTWAAGANVDVVRFFCQNGTAATMDADGTVSYIRSGVVKRQGSDFDTATGELTRSATNGGVGCDTAGTGALKLTGSTIPLSSTGLEVNLLHSWNTRKNKGVVSDSLGSNRNTENLFVYGTGSDNRMKLYYFSSFGLFQQTFTKPSGENNSDIGGSPAITKRYGQEVVGFRMNGTSTYIDTHLAESSSLTLGATNQSNVAAGNMNNGFFVYGADFSNSTGSLSGAERLNGLFSGVVLTQTLTAQERYLVKMKLGLIGQQHLRKSSDDILALFDEYFMHKDANSGTGALVGANGNATLTYNVTGTTTFDYDDPITGVQGVRFASASVNNKFVANNNYFAIVSTGTVVAFFRQELTTSNLETPLQISSTDEATASFAERSLSLGFDHDKPSAMMIVATARDTDSVTGSRKISDGRLIGDQTTNQSNGKYNRNVTHNDFLYTGETIYSYSTSEPFWKNTDGSAPFTIDAPTGHHTLSNFDFPYKNEAPLFQVATFQAPEGFNRDDPYAERKPYLLQSLNKSYLGLTGAAIGHACSDVAVNPYGAVVDGNSTSKIRSGRALGDFVGSSYFFGMTTSVLTMEQAQWLHLNSYKVMV